MSFLNFICSKRIPFLMIALVSSGVLIAAFVMENYFGIQSCAMCRYERLFFVAAIPASLLFFVVKKGRNLGLSLMTLLFIASAAFAGYHVLIQMGILPLPPFCKPADIPLDLPIEEAAELIMQTNYVPCNKVTWSLFGISLAGYNFILSLVMSVYAILGINYGRK